MTPLQRAEELLEKITPGEWYRKEGGIWTDSLKIIVASRVQLQEDSKFIAAAPALMRELVELCKEQEKELRLTKSMADKIITAKTNWIVDLTQQIEELKATIEERRKRDEEVMRICFPEEETK